MAGLALIVLNGLTINPFPPSFQKLFNSNIGDPFRWRNKHNEYIDWFGILSYLHKPTGDWKAK